MDTVMGGSNRVAIAEPPSEPSHDLVVLVRRVQDDGAEHFMSYAYVQRHSCYT